jgi:8-oxo-dGTP pyrophosphatase MutT (NUDIX family)
METLPHQLTKNVKLLQKVLLVHNGKFLIMRRSPDSATRPDQWDLPGGNSEWPQTSETLQDPHKADLVREVEEETGIEISEDDVKENVYIGTYFDAAKQMYSVVLGWKIVLPDDFLEYSVAMSDEHYEFTWLEKEDFDQFDFGFAGGKDGFITKMVEKL